MCFRLDTVWQYIQILSQDPDLWACLAQMLTPMLMAGVLPWSQLKSDLERHLSPSLSASLIAEIFVCAADLKVSLCLLRRVLTSVLLLVQGRKYWRMNKILILKSVLVKGSEICINYAVRENTVPFVSQRLLYCFCCLVPSSSEVVSFVVEYRQTG